MKKAICTIAAVIAAESSNRTSPASAKLQRSGDGYLVNRKSKMQLNRALSFSKVEHFKTMLDKLLIPRKGERDTWYSPRSGYVVDSWNNNELTVHRFANKRYSIILHMNKYHSRRRIDGLYRYLLPRLKHIEGVGIATEGEKAGCLEMCTRVSSIVKIRK